jgi:selT/selW/selH-like putative selenoprotein
LPQATSLAAELEKNFGIKAKLTPGKNGVFDVIVDGKKVYSKEVTDRFPNPGEVSALLK